VTSTWRLAGTYLEACNCEAICPCRTIGGRKGGDSTYRECLGALSWAIEEGDADGLDMSGLGVALASRYHDDEPGSPWTFALYLDERASFEQAAALEAIYTGARGGTPKSQFPWAFKPSDLVAVRSVPMEIEHSPRRGWFRAGTQVTVRVGDPVPDQVPVTCVIPGHHQPGEEVISELIEVEDGPLSFQLSGRCGYQSRFEYSSEQG
jgi:hypothetical protein